MYSHLLPPPPQAWTRRNGWREEPSPPSSSLLSFLACWVMQLPQGHPGPSSVVALERRGRREEEEKRGKGEEGRGGG